VRCGGCGRVYRFELLQSVDEDRGVRLYSLAPVPEEAMGRLVDALSPYATPSWPMWAPLWTFPTERERIAVEKVVDALMSEADAPQFAIATPGLLDRIEDARAIPANGAGAVHDWVTWMGSDPSPAESA
jgi:hypothetical protein